MVSVEEAKQYIKDNSTVSYYPEKNKVSLRLEIGPFAYVFCHNSYDEVVNAILPIAIRRIKSND